MGRRIRKIRESQHLTLQQAADLSGGMLKPGAISKYETGSCQPKAGALFALSWVFGVSLDKLFPPEAKELRAGRLAKDKAREVLR